MRYIKLLAAFLCCTFNIFAEQDIHFLSTQLNPIKEVKAMENTILKNFPLSVEYKPINDKEMANYLENNHFIDLIGGTYHDFHNLKDKNLISDVDNILDSIANNIIANFKDIAKLNSDNYYFIPWMQATYVMIANKKALKYLPPNSDINHLTYREFTEWGRNIYEKTGKNKIGFPVGKNGLWHRFLQGFLYPSYNGDMINNMNSENSIKMWQEFKELWKYVRSESLTYNKMELPLLTEEVWIAWDHTARLTETFKQKPDDFISFPAPIGPKGRGYLLILTGIAVPQNKEINEKTKKLIHYLLKDEIQVTTTNIVGFFPVVEIEKTDNLKLKEIYYAVLIQEKSKDSIPAFLPDKLGKNSSAFNYSYKSAFSKIVLRKKNIKNTMINQSIQIKKILSNN